MKKLRNPQAEGQSAEVENSSELKICSNCGGPKSLPSHNHGTEWWHSQLQFAIHAFFQVLSPSEEASDEFLYYLKGHTEFLNSYEAREGWLLSFFDVTAYGFGGNILANNSDYMDMDTWPFHHWLNGAPYPSHEFDCLICDQEEPLCVSSASGDNEEARIERAVKRILAEYTMEERLVCFKSKEEEDVK